ncbi:MAG: T9SS type A sorting domain-containing protein [Ignavibacteriales bacterium]|nr:T9SS type A sorting domain-containing protein [Ignavibacteriales bacterium]
MNEEKDFTQTIDLDELWDVDSLSVIVFVQSNASKTVYQSETINYSSLTITSIDEEGETPTEFTLEQNYPNPFNPKTKIKYTIPSNVKNQTSNVSLKVYDILGKKVAELVNENKPAGEYEILFEASELPSGIYLYQLQAGNFIESKKMILIK